MSKRICLVIERLSSGYLVWEQTQDGYSFGLRWAFSSLEDATEFMRQEIERRESEANKNVVCNCKK